MRNTNENKAQKIVYVTNIFNMKNSLL